MWHTIGKLRLQKCITVSLQYTIVRNCTHENYRSYMDVLHIEKLLCYPRHFLCGSKLHDRYDWKAMGPDTHHGLSLIQHCHAYIYCSLVSNYAWQQNSHSLWLYYTLNDGFTANDVSFYKNKFGYLLYTHYSVFPITVDTINTCMLILKLIRSSTVLPDKLSKWVCAHALQQVCCQAAKKEL